uniref:Amine oxidase domain-containing protein n=1 Tax=Schizophyllum commune (strain H4-8 / FGSC 9210) TaxID=578458 RepID=D8PKZ2_SCHCM
MILDSLGIPYEILEASDRIGGRIYTHRFNGDKGATAPINTPARYDYIDIGAMRYPNIGFMKRVFDLFELLQLDKDGLLIEYKFSSEHTFQHYNGRRYPGVAQSNDIFDVSVENGGTVPSAYVAWGADSVAAEVYKPFTDLFKSEKFSKAWAVLQQEDSHSTRAYMRGRKENPLPEAVVQWLETFETATGLYNDAFVESVMDAMDFGSVDAVRNPKGGLGYSWYCIDGGSDIITRKMISIISTEPLTEKRVTNLASTPKGMAVTYQKSGATTTEYSQVICTVPMGCLAGIDIPVGDLSYLQRMAIRSLNYDTSTKIALKFESRWWEDPKIMPHGPIKGGMSSTDLPIRTCVYPSYGFSSSGQVPGVLLASYTWAQDAQRLGGLAAGVKGSKADKVLIDLTLKNLSQLHGVPVEKFGPLLDHYAYDWHNDENARGAFALFGPAQFSQKDSGSSLFASVKAPAAGGKLHIAGEATSAHHAWVLGALNSAWRAVYNALGMREDAKEKREVLIKKWGVPDEEDTTDLLKLAALSSYGYL